MTFQSKEISESGIYAGEEEGLKEEKKILAHGQKLMTFAGFAEGLLMTDEGAAREKIHTILRQGREMMTIDPSLSLSLNALESISVQLEDVVFELRNYSRHLEINPMRLEEIENRLEEIEHLKRKYGPTLEAILDFHEKISGLLTSFAVGDEKLEQLELRLKPLQQEVALLSAKLSGERKRAAAELKKVVEKELSSLGDEEGRF